MVKKADIGSKRLISFEPNAWARWVTQDPDVTAQAILASEFQWISRESDVLIKVFSPIYGEFLILNEIQPLRKNAITCLFIPFSLHSFHRLPIPSSQLNTVPLSWDSMPNRITMSLIFGKSMPKLLFSQN
jgi:hypothetical protein